MSGQTARLGNRLAQLGRIVLGQAPAQAALAPQSLPALLVEWSPTTGPMGAAVWTDISESAMSIQTARGRQYELDRIEAGTLTLTLRDDDRRFDPMNTSGPYAGSLVPGKRIRIRANWEGVWHPLFMGYVETWSLPFWQFGHMLTTVKASDGFGLLANRHISSSFPQQRTDERIRDALTAAGWSTGQGWILGDAVYGVLGTTTIPAPVGETAISAGQTTVQAATLVDVPALTHVQLMAKAENGMVFVGPDGAVTFRSRHELLYDQEVMATFGSDPNAGELPYPDAAVDATGARIYNDVRVTRTGGVVQVAQDQPSIDAYFGRTYSLTGLPLLTDQEALSYATFILARSKDFHVRVTGLVVESRMDPDALWPQALSRDLGDRVRVIYRPYLGSVMNETVMIQRVSHEFSTERGDWRTTWALSPANLDTAWILGTSTLGTDTVPAY